MGRAVRGEAINIRGTRDKESSEHRQGSRRDECGGEDFLEAQDVLQLWLATGSDRRVIWRMSVEEHQAQATVNSSG